MSLEDEIRQRAEDLAAYSAVSVDEAAGLIWDALTVDAPPISHVRKRPWWLRPWLPLRWQQRWILHSISLEETDTP